MAISPPETASAVPVLSIMIRETDGEHPRASDHEITARVIDILREEDDPFETIRPAINWYVSKVRRANVRRTERRVAANWNPSTMLQERIADAATLRDYMGEYAQEYVDIPGVGRLRAGAVTIPEWQVRRNSMQKGVERDQATIAFVDTILDELKASKATSIDVYLKKRK